MRVGMMVLAGLLASVASGPAEAQSPWIERGYYEGLPTRVIMRMVRSRGLMPMSRPKRRGPHYLVEAEDDLGRMRRVVIDARSARIVRVEVAGRNNFARGRGPDEEPRTFAMRPPRGVPETAPDFPDEDGYGDTGPARRPLPPLRPRASLPDEPEADEGPEPPRNLPPLRPRASLPQEPPDVVTGPERDGARALPPPPTPERRAAPAPTRQPAGERRSTPRSAAVNPSAPPIPRPRPAGNGNAAAAIESAQPTATPLPRKGLPRVVLPGGPLPRGERSAETRPGQREHERSATGSSAPAASTDGEQADHSATHAIPPVQPLN